MSYIGIKPYTNWRYPFHTIKEWVTETPRDIKYFFQRGWRGYADTDVWSVDWYLSSFMPAAIAKLRADTHGYPMGMEEWADSEDDQIAVWAAILTAIEDGFQAAMDLQDHPYLDDYKGDLTFSIDKDGRWMTEKDPFSIWLDEHREEHRAIDAANYEKMNFGLDLFKEFYLNLWD
jgi:hypothetical protein